MVYQFRFTTWGRSWVTLACCCVVVAGCTPPTAQDSAPPPAAVRVWAARLGEIAIEIPTVGTVVPSATSEVAAALPGKVVEYPFREGQYVNAGEALAKLRSVSLEIQLRKGRALLREAEQQHKQLAAGYRPEEIRQARARMLSAQSHRELAETTERRRREANERNEAIFTEEELASLVAAAEEAKHMHEEATADFDMKSSGYRQEEVAAAAALMEAQQEAVAQLEDDLARHEITAPFGGYIVAEHTDVGEWVDTGGLVATVANLEDVEVHVRVEELYIHELSVGQEVEVVIDALGGRTISGTIQYIVPRADWQSGSRSFPVIVRMTNTSSGGQPLLKEGMVARIVFRGAPREGLLVHKDAIDRSSGEPMVFIVDKDNRVRAAEVVEGISSGEFVAVEGNIRPGDLLVTEGVERLKPFDKVAILESADPTERIAAPGDNTDPAKSEREEVDSEPTNSGGL